MGKGWPQAAGLVVLRGGRANRARASRIASVLETRIRPSVRPWFLYLLGSGALSRERRSLCGALQVGRHPGLAGRAVDGGAPAANGKRKAPQRSCRGARVQLANDHNKDANLSRGGAR